MTTEHLSSSEAHTVDLVAMRAWHWKASMDPKRDHEMRAWHRQQVHWINLRMSAHTDRKTTTEVMALVELMADEAHRHIHKEIGLVCAGDWEKNCQLAREAIIQKLKAHPPFDHLLSDPEPYGSPDKSSQCGSAGRAAEDCQPNVEPNSSAPSEAKA